MPPLLDQLDANLRGARTLQAPQQVAFDHGLQQYVVGPAAFRPQSDGTISLDLEEALLSDGLPIDGAYGGVARAVGLVAHTVGRLEAAGFAVSHRPVDGNDYHGEAAGSPSRSERRALADTCEIVRAIDQVEAARQQRLDDERLAALARKNVPTF